MKKEDHLKAFEEHKETIFDWALGVKGLNQSQRIVGLHASRGIVEFLTAYLHKKGKISLGAQINHRWFKSEKVFEKLPNFPKKKTIVKKIIELENLSEDLAYGSPKPVERVKSVLELFRDIEDDIKKLG